MSTMNSKKVGYYTLEFKDGQEYLFDQTEFI